jgi:hypothetical protein
MKIGIVISVFVTYVNAAYYILDVQHWSADSIIFKGDLKYIDDYSGYKHCTSGNAGLQINKGGLGASVSCKNANVDMGLYFPHGYNGTISEVYDYHNKVFYPCTQINNENDIISYACANIMV